MPLGFKARTFDGISAEVLTRVGIALLSVTDAELQQACMRVYNDWLAEFCSHSPEPPGRNRTLLAPQLAGRFGA